jgi:hypothetical protein
LHILEKCNIFFSPDFKKVLTKHEGNTTASGCGRSHTTSDSWIDKSGIAFTHAMDDFLVVGHYLVIGAFIAALAQIYIDRSSFLSLTALPELTLDTP